MKKMSLIILAAFTVACLFAVVAGLGRHSSTVEIPTENPVAWEAAELEDADYNTTSIFGLWFHPELNPYESTDYYLHDNLVPESDSAKNLPFKIYTQAHTYELDSYKPEMVEYGYAWLNLKELDENGDILSETPFRYSPSGFAKLRYNAFSQTVSFAD